MYTYKRLVIVTVYNFHLKIYWSSISFRIMSQNPGDNGIFTKRAVDMLKKTSDIATKLHHDKGSQVLAYHVCGIISPRC
jgi:hypothetical protein